MDLDCPGQVLPSFGYGEGDFYFLTQFARRVRQNSQKTVGDHDELTREVTSLDIILRRLYSEVSKLDSILISRDSNFERRNELARLSSDCRRVLGVVDTKLQKYNSLSEEQRKVRKFWERVTFGNGEMLSPAETRLRLETITSALTLFLNQLSIESQSKVEGYLESQVDELGETISSPNLDDESSFEDRGKSRLDEDVETYESTAASAGVNQGTLADDAREEEESWKKSLEKGGALESGGTAPRDILLNNIDSSSSSGSQGGGPQTTLFNIPEPLAHDDAGQAKLLMDECVLHFLAVEPQTETELTAEFPPSVLVLPQEN